MSNPRNGKLDTVNEDDDGDDDGDDDEEEEEVCPSMKMFSKIVWVITGLFLLCLNSRIWD